MINSVGSDAQAMPEMAKAIKEVDIKAGSLGAGYSLSTCGKKISLSICSSDFGFIEFLFHSNASASEIRETIELRIIQRLLEGDKK